MLTNNVCRRIDLEHEPGSWIEVKPMSLADDTDARAARTVELMRRRMQMDPQVLAWFREQVTDGEPRPRIVLEDPDPLDDYDLATLLRLCIVAWSYDAPVSSENIAALDAHTARVVARALVPRPEPEETRGNGSVRSTASSTESPERTRP